MPASTRLSVASETDSKVGDVEWCLMGSSKWKTVENSSKKDERLMIQNLTEGSFTKVCNESGAGESVCPVDAFPSYELKKSAKTGATYTAAGGQSLVNVGEKRPCFETNGIVSWTTFQATTKVQKPLAAATRITEKGNRIVLDDVDSERYIQNKKTGKKIPLNIENVVYMMEMFIKPTPFQRQAKK